MSALKKLLPPNLKVWVEIDKSALIHNLNAIRSLLRPSVGLWAVVKSNAYGHGLLDVARLLASRVQGFCVDSVAEGLALREQKIKNQILVLGPTLPALFSLARRKKITLTVADFSTLRALTPKGPEFHLKFDTGMHRQGFLPEEASRVARFSANKNLPLRGVYSHFAGEEASESTSRFDRQFKSFNSIVSSFSLMRYPNLVYHIAATDGVMRNQDFHLDLVRVGIGLYGGMTIFYNGEALPLKPVLSWRTIVAEVKLISAGERVGYAPGEVLKNPTRLALLPIGYWHGFPRSLSHVGQVLIRGKLARVIGLVSMDLMTVDASAIPAVKKGDLVTIIGRDGQASILASDLAVKCETIPYEILTRTNPLMRRFVV